MFIPRLKKPESGNKYYNTPAKGGYAVGAILGKPTDSGCNVLANCFSGDTKIITRDGVVRLDAIEGKDVEVLSRDGVYRKARGEYFGRQRMFKVKLKNGDEFICTGNHRWLVHRFSGWNGKKYENVLFKTTIELNGSDYIPYSKIDDVSVDRTGIIHGFIYGDGSYYNEYRHSQANLCGYKREYMLEYFEDAKHINEQANGTICCYPYPKEYKSIPDVSEYSLEYLRGFIAGLIASDGCVDTSGCVSISTVKSADAKKISNILSVLGYRNHICASMRDTNYKANSWIYVIRIKKSFIPISIILNPKHQERFLANDARNDSFTKVAEVIDLEYEEDVYCVQEPETHTMTLDGCILTGQCVGYAAGRFNEIIGADKWLYLLYPPNAEYFISMAAKQGLKTGAEPKLGAIICWEGIGSAAGHVAIVEQINADGSIVTSESGYNCKNPFWTTHRYKELGNWGQNATKYKFQGFIYQPEGGKDLNGIDISYCQKKVDWTKVNVDFVIIRAGYGRYTHQKDTMFEDHYAGAKQRGIPVGAYWYSYAKSEEDARKEADACLEILKGKQFEYPIYYDVEEKDTLNLGKEKVSAIIRAFLERVEAAGYWVGLYMSRSPLENIVAEDVRKRYAIWLAEWDVVKPTYKGAYGVWQNGTGTVSGFPDKVDTDVCYVDYPTQIKAKGLNGYGGEPEPPLPESKYFEITVDGKTYAGNLTLK